MDFVQTNNNPVAKWADRPKPTDATQAQGRRRRRPAGEQGDRLGIRDRAGQRGAQERLGERPGPRDATITCRNLATLLRDTLAPDLNIYRRVQQRGVEHGVQQDEVQPRPGRVGGGRAGVEPQLRDLTVDTSSRRRGQHDTWADRRYARRVKQISDMFRASGPARAGRPDQHPRAAHPRQPGGEPVPVRRRAEVPEQLYGAPKNYFYGIGIAPYINLGDQQNTCRA